jgi:hypothetical protein
LEICNEWLEVRDRAGNFPRSFLIPGTIGGSEDLAQPGRPKKIRSLTAEQMARMERREMDGLQREFKTVSVSYGDTVLNLVVASGCLSSLIRNPQVSGYLKRHHPETLIEFRAIAATSLEESGSGASK